MALPGRLPEIDGSGAETIFCNGDILTGAGLEAARVERVTALAVSGGEIVAAGQDAEVLEAYRGASTEVVDLRGAFALPGFNDAHLHLGMGARILLSVNLLGARSLAEMQARVRAASEMAGPGGARRGEWLTGGGWAETLWAERRVPNRGDLDAVTAGHPAVFLRVDVHAAVANSAALAAAAVTRATRDPEGGVIERDARGEPTGVLRETAMALVQAPGPTPEQRRRGLELALADAAAHGVTSVQDFSDWEDVLVLEAMEREGKLPLRVTEWLPFTDSLAMLKEKRTRLAGGMLRAGMVKGFLDGSLGSRTAALKEPYADDAGNAGLPRFAQAELNAMAAERARAGFQLGFHAIGDGAVEMALKAIADATAEPGVRGLDARARIEHSQVAGAADFERYRELGVIASVQPNHMLTDMAWAEQRLGAERTARAYAWRAFHEAGVTLAFGTDYPVEPVTPFRGLYAAATRMNEAGTESFHPEQAVTMEQALWAYTQGAAYAEFAEGWKGKLAPGYVADFVVLDRDVTRVSAQEVLETRVLRTVVGGRTVYERG